MAGPQTAPAPKPEVEWHGSGGRIDRDLEQSTAVAVPPARKAGIDKAHDFRQARSPTLCASNTVGAKRAEISEKRGRTAEKPPQLDARRSLQNAEQIKKEDHPPRP
jgi:hypothetical protein